MAGFRSNIKRAARRALCAFIIIIAPSLAELHWAAATASAAVRQSQPLGDTASAGDLAAFSQASQPKPDSGSDGDGSPRNARQADGCGICAALDTANAILFAPPPLLLLPQMLEFLQQATDAEFAHLKSIGLTSHRSTRPTS
jgi:Protein of unknown function (DUF2946)